MDNNILQRAQELHKNGQIEEAIELYQEALLNETQSTDILHSLVIAYAQQDDYENALEYIIQAIGIDDKEASLHNSHGNILLRLNKIKPAIKAYQTAIQLNSKNIAAHTNLGRCYYFIKDFKQAEACYKIAIDLNPQETNALFNLALLQLNNNTTKAIATLNKILTISPTHSPANNQLGQILLDQGNTDQAIKHFTLAIEQHPLQIETLNSLGQAYIKKGEYDQAILSLEQCLMIEPKHPEVNYQLATAYLYQGDHSKALNYYLRQNEVKPSTECFYNIGVLLMYLERNQEAMEYLHETLKLDPNNLPAHINIGSIYLKTEQLDKALQHYQQALAINPNDKEITHIIAALDENQNPQQAPQEYVQHLFDNYAPYYDKHLTEQLKFQVPQKLKQALYEESGVETPIWTTLDLGCGTGLSGEAMASVSKKLIGIDASPKMLAMAKQKDIYDQLIPGDIHQHIQNYTEIDLVVASDVFTYIGDLSTIFQAVSHALANNGLFAFSVEQGFEKDYQLQKNIRYQHNKSYIENLLKTYQFEILRFDNLILRQQKKQPVNGYLVIARKSQFN